MLDLQLLVLPLDLTQRLQLGGYRRTHLRTLGHNDPLPRESSPTRQHVRMDLKRVGDVADQGTGLLA